MGSRNKHLRLSSIKYYSLDLYEDWSFCWNNLQIQSSSKKCCRSRNRICRVINHCCNYTWTSNNIGSRWREHISNSSSIHMVLTNIKWRVIRDWLHNWVGLRNRNLCSSSIGHHNDILYLSWLVIRNNIQLQGLSKKCYWIWLTYICFHNCCSYCPWYSNSLNKRQF